MNLSDFDYILPPELIAQYPGENRSDSRMLVLRRKDGSIEDRRFNELPDIIDATYFLVVNDSRVFKARLFARRPTGGRVEIFLVRRQSGSAWQVFLRPSAKIKLGERLFFDGGDSVCVLDSPGTEERLIEFAAPHREAEIIERLGQVPLPPYIRRDVAAVDVDRYQTIYADETGSVAAPTAGLHFDLSILERLRVRDIEMEKVTLHVGPGTFKPVTAERIEDHVIEPESAVISPAAAEKINRHKEQGKKLLAVGTTSVRTLEAAAAEGRLRPYADLVGLYIYPPYRFRMVDALLTNFHLPKTSLLMLAAAFCGRDFLMAAYRHAVEQKYRFYSYGDCMLIL